ncbi:hypothetical protein HPB52_004932 [Rhipicephalus sanguineus]|uniref:THAP-type domain-containing protein n=1 Tax=Rhipicephalus sanguineus TaxID=34632 RepID=A0A9D4T5K7_RHISA|nr:hypothetical protein HPB52_004932 [Rhipicephalus sanguineus]
MEPDQSGGVTDVEMNAEMTGHRRAFGRNTDDTRPMCRVCEQEEETIPHLVLRCRRLCPRQREGTTLPEADPALHAQWQRAVPRAEKKLEENCAVCELHFNDRFISRYFEPTVNEPGLCCFREQFPTQFPNLPAYCPKRLLCSDERLSPSVGKNSSCTGAGGRTASQRAPRNQDRPTPVCRW